MQLITRSRSPHGSYEFNFKTNPNPWGTTNYYFWCCIAATYYGVKLLLLSDTEHMHTHTTIFRPAPNPTMALETSMIQPANPDGNAPQ